MVSSATRMMFIKHYAPNRCLCIKVAKGGGGEGGASGWGVRVDVNGEVKFVCVKI